MDGYLEQRKYIVLIIYDIIDNKRRLTLSKLLCGYGIRVQKSSFEACLNKKQYDKMLQRIKLLVKGEDNIRVYKLSSYEEVVVFGKKEYPEEEVVIV